MFLDTSIIVDIFQHELDTPRFKKIAAHIENEALFVSMFQLAELSDWALKNGVDENEAVSNVKKLASVVPLDEGICLHASRLKNEMRKEGMRKFSLADGIIMASARSIGQKLLTRDSDFRKLGDAVVLR